MSDATIHSFRTINQPGQTDAATAVKHAGPQTSTTNKPYQGGQPAAAIKADQAQLSVASGLITKAFAAPDVRADKVASLQKAIAAGTYNVSSHDVAGKLLQSLLGE